MKADALWKIFLTKISSNKLEARVTLLLIVKLFTNLEVFNFTCQVFLVLKPWIREYHFWYNVGRFRSRTSFSWLTSATMSNCRLRSFHQKSDAGRFGQVQIGKWTGPVLKRHGQLELPEICREPLFAGLDVALGESPLSPRFLQGMVLGSLRSGATWWLLKKTCFLFWGKSKLKGDENRTFLLPPLHAVPAAH